MVKINLYIRKILLVIVLLVTNNIFSQNSSKIEESDVVYIYFKETLYKQIFLAQRDGYGDFLFEFDKPYRSHNLIFYIDPLIRPFSLNVKKEKKSFLKKQKDLILNYDFLINMYSYDTAEKLLLSKKRIYIINHDDIGCFSIKLLEVKFFNKKLLVPFE